METAPGKIDLGPTPYDQFVEREGIPVLKGYHVPDIMDVELEPWARMGAHGCYLNLADQQDTDGYGVRDRARAADAAATASVRGHRLRGPRSGSDLGVAGRGCPERPSSGGPGPRSPFR